VIAARRGCLAPEFSKAPEQADDPQILLFLPQHLDALDRAMALPSGTAQIEPLLTHYH
jgi:hypothetical protein